jgi:drug/metabolite transporter (DMT)-like permease
VVYGLLLAKSLARDSRQGEVMTSGKPRSWPSWVTLIPYLFVLIWSTGFISARLGMPYAPALTFLTLRCALSVLCFVLWVWICRVPWPQGRAQWGHLLLAGVLLHGGYLSGVWLAIKAGMGAGLTALIVGLQPILTALWLSWVNRSGQGSAASASERVNRWQWLGLLLGFAGLVLVLSGKLKVSMEVSVTTLMFTLMALLSITVGTLYQKRFVKPCDVRTGNAVQLLGAALVCLPFALFDTEVMNWQPPLIFSMVWSVLVLSLGGSSLFYVLIQRGAATSVTSLLYLVPPTTAGIAWVLFGEPISLMTLLGTGVTALGVWLVVGQKSVPAAAPDA